MINQRQNHLYKIYLLLFFLVLTLPLFSLKPMFHPSEFAKSAVFMALFPVLFLIFIYQLFFKENLEGALKIKEAAFNKRSAIFLPFWLIIFYLILSFLATLFSLDIKYSLWSSPLRGGGFVISAFLIIFSLLLFFILKAKDWQKIWDYVFGVGVVASFIAIFQKFSLFGSIFVGHADRPFSTFGNSISLSLFLVLLIFLSVSFTIIKKNKIRKIFFLCCLVLFLFTILISATRAAFLGIAAGFSFFLFLFPLKGRKITLAKIAFLILIILVVAGVIWLKGEPELAKRLSENKAVGASFDRTWSMVQGFSFEKILVSRVSGWQVAVQAIKDRPIFGYGPENFSIAFDRYYDPNLPGLEMSDPSQGRTGWWDKAHSFFFEIGTTAGIPALIAYLLIFIVLFWQLQKIKNKYPDGNLIIHGVQATFIGYLVADFFSFDSFSTNLIAFLLIAYSLFLIKKEENTNIVLKPAEKIYSEQPFWKYFLLFFFFIFTAVFVWNYSIKSLLINKDLNKAISWSNSKKCDAAINKTEDLMEKNSGTMNTFIRLTYLDILGGGCLAKANDSQKIELYYGGIKRLKELQELRPFYTRNWLYYVFYASQIIEGDKNLSKEAKEELEREAFISLERALALSPKRQPIFIAGAKLNFSLGKYQESKKMAADCIEINPNYPDCWWAKANIYLKLGEVKEGTEIVKSALKNGFFDGSDDATKNALAEFINLYSSINKKAQGKEKAEYYELLSLLYQKIIKIDYKNFQYHASLAFIYKELGEYDKAREEAMLVLELSPQTKKTVDEFLESFPK